MDKLLKKAMADCEVKNARQLHQMTGGKVSYMATLGAINGKNTSLVHMVALFDAMGLELTYKKK